MRELGLFHGAEAINTEADRELSARKRAHEIGRMYFSEEKIRRTGLYGVQGPRNGACQ